MRESVSPLLVCAAVGGAHMRARAVCVHAAFKLTAKLLHCYEKRGDLDAAISVVREALAGLRPLLCSEDMEVQERAHNATALLSLLLPRLGATDGDGDLPHVVDGTLVDHEQSNGLEKQTNGENVNGEESHGFSGGLIEELVDLFEGELKPVAPKAQKKVPMPPDLDLNQWLSRDHWSSESSSSEEEADGGAVFAAPQPDPRPTAQFTPEELQMLREARRQEQANNPHYLKDDSPRSYQQEDVPIAEIALEVPLQIQSKRSDKYLISKESSKKTKKEKRSSKKRKSKKDKHSSESDSDDGEESIRRPAVDAGGELPDGAAPSDDEPPPPHDDPHRALDLDLDLPLREEELLTSRIHQYPSPESGLLAKKSKESKKSKSAKKESTEKSVKKKKEKKSKHDKKVDLMLSESTKSNVNEGWLIDDLSKSNEKTATKASDNDKVLIDNHVKSSKTEKNKKSKRDAKEKDSKKKKSSKKDKHETKIGYEEALGISTPSKEVI